VASARWLRDSDEEGRPGLLFLTDQRIIFVRHEQVVRQRFLFITLKRELIQTLDLEVPVRSVTKVQTAQERSGLLGLESTTVIDIHFDETAPLGTGRWVLRRDDGSIWVALINRARTGDIDAERTDRAADAADELDAARRQAPTQCPNCSAPLELPAVRGAMAITCAYCGTTISY
jgi:LSD1 subclass zinc finger protein